MNTLQRLRTMNGMTPADLARRTRALHERTIERMEAGEITLGDIDAGIRPTVEARLQAALRTSEPLAALLRQA